MKTVNANTYWLFYEKPFANAIFVAQKLIKTETLKKVSDHPASIHNEDENNHDVVRIVLDRICLGTVMYAALSEEETVVVTIVAETSDGILVKAAEELALKNRWHEIPPKKKAARAIDMPGGNIVRDRGPRKIAT